MAKEVLTEQAPSEISRMVHNLYVGTVIKAGAVGGLLGVISPAIYPVVFYPWLWSRCKRAVPYLVDGIRDAAHKVVSLSNQAMESDFVNYWKDFVRGIPEYSALVRANKFNEIENILITLARQNEVLRQHDDRIREIQKAMKELRDETGAL